MQDVGHLELCIQIVTMAFNNLQYMEQKYYNNKSSKQVS